MKERAVVNGFRPAVFFRGMAMGAADIVPGVSGGTIAFITGIYDELIDSLRAFNLEALRVLRRKGMWALWQHLNAGFLLNLVTGILLSALSLAKLISHALQHYPVPLAAFFFGLVLASAIVVYREIPRRSVAMLAMLVLGAAAALAVAEMRPAQIEVSPLTIFLSGAIAICAMILPGISGSFILLMLGMYLPVIDAIKTVDLSVMGIFGLGCATGLMLFVRLLSWLLHHHHARLLAFLCGLLLGSLSIIWPWKLDAQIGAGVLGQSLDLHNVWPWEYAAVQPPQWGVSGVLMFFGIMLVLAIEHYARVGKSED